MSQSFLQKEVLITVKDSEKVHSHLNLIKKARAKTNLSWATFFSSVGKVSDQLHQKSYILSFIMESNLILSLMKLMKVNLNANNYTVCSGGGKYTTKNLNEKVHDVIYYFQ
jgi:hypothetical protein